MYHIWPYSQIYWGYLTFHDGLIERTLIDLLLKTNIYHYRPYVSYLPFITDVRHNFPREIFSFKLWFTLGIIFDPFMIIDDI